MPGPISRRQSTGSAAGTANTISGLSDLLNTTDSGYEYTAGFAGKTTVTTTLSAGVGETGDTLPVVDESGFDASGGRAIIGDSEIITYTGTSTGLLTGVARGQLGSTAASHLSGETIHKAEFAWDSLDGVNYTTENATNGDWIKFPLSRTVHLATDVPYWSTPTPTPHVGKGIFGGEHLPSNVTGFYDFESTGWPDGTTSSLNFQQCKTGDLLLCRFDFEVIPQIANSTLEVGLTFATRDPSTLDVTFEFPLTTTPIFFGTGTVGKTFLNRPFISAYFASDEDRFALALPAVKCDNQIIIRPLSMLTTIVR